MPSQPALTTTAPAVAVRGRLLFDPQWCRACQVCAIVCSLYHEGQARPALARIKIAFDEFAVGMPISGVVCAQCVAAPCMQVCRYGAMTRDARNGAIVVQTELCVGCMRCRKACPWNIPLLHPEQHIALKCDLCGDRPGGPVCVERCPMAGRALSYVVERPVGSEGG